MRIPIFLSICFIFFISCQSPSSNTDIAEVISPTFKKVIEATYMSATVYAGKTDFEFVTDAGVTFLAAQYLLHPEDPDNEETNFAVPPNMLEDETNIEGVPGANPALIGRKFQLFYDDEDKLSKVALVEDSKKVVIATYQMAQAMHTSITYTFTSKAGYDFVAINDISSGAKALDVSEALLDFEEPRPRPNYDMVGHKFKLHYNDKDSIYKVELIQASLKEVMAIYNSAAVYPDHTIYEFLNKYGESVLVNGPAPSEEENENFPAVLLEEDEGLEGPPGENPDLVGKAFTLYYNVDNKVVKVALVND